MVEFSPQELTPHVRLVIKLGGSIAQLDRDRPKARIRAGSNLPHALTPQLIR